MVPLRDWLNCHKSFSSRIRSILLLADLADAGFDEVFERRLYCNRPGEIPFGLGTTTLVLFMVGIANLFSKRIATIYGVSFTILLYALFLISERINAGRAR